MNTPTNEPANDLGTLVDDARALLTATADVAGDKIDEARRRLAAALGDGREMVDRVREKAEEGAVAAGDAVHHHPYQAIAIGFGLGAILGFIAARRGT